ncbi:MAG: hypothetical protein HRU33_03810 [Rhodobacteraceae bacterium]|nr:hypothetical protein [Paracoccaceae bacterium]
MFRLIFKNRLAAFIRREDGWVTIWSIFMIVANIMILGVALDYANAFRMKEKLQAAVDAAALAAAIDLPDMGLATSAGLSIGAKFLNEPGDEIALQAFDFTYGFMNPQTNQIAVGLKPFNAVMVSAGRLEDRGNELKTYVVRLIGKNFWDISVSSTAIASGALCKGGGLFSDTEVLSGSNNDYSNKFCLYGRNGVKISSDNSFSTESKIEMRKLSNFQQGGNNRGARDALNKNQYTLKMPGKVSGIVASLKAGSFADLPSYIKFGPVYKSKIEESDYLEPYTLYIVNDVADLGSHRNISNVAIVAKKEVKVGSYNQLHNVFFASMDKILLGSNNTIGSANPCSSGKYNSFIYSGSNIEFGSNNALNGIQMASKDQLKLGSDITGQGIYAEASGLIDFGSADHFEGCPFGLISEESTFSSFALVR